MQDKMREIKNQSTQAVDGVQSLTEPRKRNKVSVSPVRVIITMKKNSSWVDDLDAHERLTVIQRVFH
jgi:hypothetical protein